MKSILSRRLAAQIGLALAFFNWCAFLHAQDTPAVLDLPRIMREQAVERARGAKLLQAGQPEEALELFQRCVQRVPFDPLAYYSQGCAQALLNQPEAALDSLQKAIDYGFRSREALEKSPDLASLRPLREFTALLVASSGPPPKEVPGWKYAVTVTRPQDGVLKLEPANMLWNQAGHILQVFVNVSDAGKAKTIAGADDAVGKLLKRWSAEGKAAGNIGDLYDNHDRGHSTLSPSAFPQLTRIEYGDEIRKRQFDTGLQRHFIYTHAELASAKRDASKAVADGGLANVAGQAIQVQRAIVLGNSSTALTGSAMWRSMPRLALTSPGGAELILQHYLNNHLYVYPEHRDHDPGHDAKSGWGDVFFANTPYFLIPQGSSGTDQPFLRALAATLAAFPEDVKEHLRTAGLVSPTLQMIFRRCNRQVQSDEDYLSGTAHPTVFDGTKIDAERMVKMANELKRNEVPPPVMLRVDSDINGDPRKDYFDAEPSEGLLTTPFAIARAGYSTQFWREMQVTAAPYGSVQGEAPELHWVVLRGDPERIEIKPVEGQPNSRVIRVGYHRRQPVEPDSAIESNRVDIGVFAYNGHHYSAPSFVSFYFPDNEVRQYDGDHRILAVDYVKAAANYADPAIVPRRDWRDEYHYDSDGTLTGWTRMRGDKHEEFNADGQLVVASSDSNDSPKARPVRYERTPNPDGSQSVQQIVLETRP